MAFVCCGSWDCWGPSWVSSVEFGWRCNQKHVPNVPPWIPPDRWRSLWSPQAAWLLWCSPQGARGKSRNVLTLGTSRWPFACFIIVLSIFWREEGSGCWFAYVLGRTNLMMPKCYMALHDLTCARMTWAMAGQALAPLCLGVHWMTTLQTPQSWS